MTKFNSPRLPPSCQGATNPTAKPSTLSNCATLLKSAVSQSTRSISASPQLSTKESSKLSVESILISPTLWRSGKIYTGIHNSTSQKNRAASVSWIRRGTDRQHTVHLWNPQNSTPRDFKRLDNSLEEPSIPCIQPGLEGTVVSRTDGDSPLLAFSDLGNNQSNFAKISNRQRYNLQYDTDPITNNASKANLTSLPIEKKISNEKQSYLGKEPEIKTLLRGNRVATTLINSSTPLDTHSNLSDKYMMPDLERGLRPRYADSNNSVPILQYANRDSSSAHAGIGSAPSPAISDDSSILGSDLGEYSPEEWGPQHPCYPHLNPHVPISSPLFRSTRIIRIQRDWMLEGDLAPTFSNLYPEILDSAGVSEQEFRRLLESLNKELIPAFDPFSSRNITDGIICILTGWLWEDAGLVAIKERLCRIEKILEDWNHDIEEKLKDRVEVNAIPRALPLKRTGYMTVSLVPESQLQANNSPKLDIQVPNPEISISHD